jgi:hypothetical protein
MKPAGSDLEALARQLACHAAQPSLVEGNGHHTPLSSQLQRLRLAFGDSGALAASPRSARAQLAFRSGQPLRFIDLKYLCHAANRPNAWDGRRLLDDPRLLAQLLRQVVAWLPQMRRFRQCYRGLLVAYRSCEMPQAVGPAALAKFLQAHQQAVAQSVPALEWTRTLAAEAATGQPPGPTP